jgi:uncharacterized protein (TIGR02145 family)
VISTMTSTICSGNSFTVAPVDGTNGIVPAGTTYTWGTPIVTGGITGGAAGNGAANISGTLVNPTNIVQTETYTVTPASGTCVGNTFTVTVSVNPVAAITAMTTFICSGTSFNLTPANGTNGIVPAGTTYSWPAPVVTGGLSGGVASSGSPTSITGTLTNPATTAQTATYTVTPTSGTCSGNTFTVTVTVDALPSASIIGSANACQNSGTPNQYQTSVILASPATYSWSVTGVSGIISPSNTANPVTISWSTPGSATIFVNVVSAGGCTNSGSLTVNIHTPPSVTFTLPCFEQITNRSAKRFQLRGGNPPYSLTGSPLQGVYQSSPPTPALQVDPNGNYYFNPSVVPGTGTVNFNISYTYSNQWGCAATASSTATIVVLGPNPSCGATITDPRDGKIYKTAILAGRCWMIDNLNYGVILPVSTPQADNCQVEKYCPPSDPACSTYGGYYQWDEVVQYATTDAPYQGVCPPGWHVPSEGDWQNLIDLLDPAYTTPRANAIAGSELKDRLETFKAPLKGINYLEGNNWTFTSGIVATMYWTSTPSGTTRAIARGLNDPYNFSVSRYASSAANGFPVRCLKD